MRHKPSKTTHHNSQNPIPTKIYVSDRLGKSGCVCFLISEVVIIEKGEIVEAKAQKWWPRGENLQNPWVLHF